jgi:hypothetical protein
MDGDFNSFLWRSAVFRKGTMLTAMLVAGATVGLLGHKEQLVRKHRTMLQGERLR